MEAKSSLNTTKGAIIEQQVKEGVKSNIQSKTVTPGSSQRKIKQQVANDNLIFIDTTDKKEIEMNI